MCLTAERNIDGSSRILGSWLGCSLTVHPAANGYLMATLAKLTVAKKGTGHPTSPSNGHSPNVRNRTWDSPLPLPYILFKDSFHYSTVQLVGSKWFHTNPYPSLSVLIEAFWFHRQVLDSLRPRVALHS